jgi:hypothetical protein
MRDRGVRRTLAAEEHRRGRNLCCEFPVLRRTPDDQTQSSVGMTLQHLHEIVEAELQQVRGFDDADRARIRSL